MTSKTPESSDFTHEVTPQEVLLVLAEQLAHEDEWFLRTLQEEFDGRTTFNRQDIEHVLDRVLDRYQVRQEEIETWKSQVN